VYKLILFEFAAVNPVAVNEPSGLSVLLAVPEVVWIPRSL
jgi:hypothetical protein